MILTRSLAYSLAHHTQADAHIPMRKHRCTHTHMHTRVHKHTTHTLHTHELHAPLAHRSPLAPCLPSPKVLRKNRLLGTSPVVMPGGPIEIATLALLDVHRDDKLTCPMLTDLLQEDHIGAHRGELFFKIACQPIGELFPSVLFGLPRVAPWIRHTQIP